MNVMIIPAAGRGTRLNFSGPKLLYPLGGKTLIAHLIARYQAHIDLFVLVINPDVEDAVRAELEQLLDQQKADFLIDFQPDPTGMLDAITVPMKVLQERYSNVENIWISWCDQASISTATVETLHNELSKLAKQSSVYMALPTVQVAQPYIHMQRDEQGQINQVLQRRENDAMPALGENDCGLFAMSQIAYFQELKAFAAIDQTMGSETQERNFLPFIAWLSQRSNLQDSELNAVVNTFPAASAIETLGVNTVDDAQQLLAAWGADSNNHH